MPATRIRLPDVRHSITHSFDIVQGLGKPDLSFYIICGMYPNGKLGEIFIEHGGSGSFVGSTLDTIAMCISIGIQSDIQLEVFCLKLRGIRVPPNGPVMKVPTDLLHELNGQAHSPYYNCTSILDYISRYLLWLFPGGILREDRRDILSNGRETPNQEEEEGNEH